MPDSEITVPRRNGTVSVDIVRGDASGALESGGLPEGVTGASTGGNGAADANKLVIFEEFGALAGSLIQIRGGGEDQLAGITMESADTLRNIGISCPDMETTDGTVAFDIELPFQSGRILLDTDSGFISHGNSIASVGGDLSTHTANTSNPHSVTKTQVGLSSVENTALSTWGGTTSITTLGTITTGTVPVARVSGLGTLATQSGTFSGTSSGTNTGDQSAASLGLVIGTNVQAYDADLTTWAGITPGTGVGTALAVNVGSAGAFVTFNGALGTPSSGVATNLTGTASGLTAGSVTTNANLTGHVTSTGNAAVLGIFTVAQLNTAISDADVATLGNTNTFTGRQVVSLNGAASTPPTTLTGTWFSGGSATTTKPQLLIEPSGATSTAWSTSGTGIGVNSATGFAGNLVDVQTNGTWRMRVDSNGDINLNGSRRVSTNSNIYIGNAGTVFIDGTCAINYGLYYNIQALSGAGAVNLTTPTTALTSTGAAQALTLANGTAGQIKTIVHDVDGGDMILTPTTKTGFTTITFTNAGDTAMLQYFTTRGWMILSVRGATVA